MYKYGEIGKEYNMKAVVLLSGGLDSTTLVYDMVHRQLEVRPISFMYGQKHSKELEAARATCDKLGLSHRVLDLSVLNQVAPSALTRSSVEIPIGHYQEDSMKATVVPNRNMVLLSLATSYAISIGAASVWYGAHSGDHAIYPDCRPEFVAMLGAAIKICDWHSVELITPYLHSSKNDIIKTGIALRVDYSLTWTCYEGKELACGKCGSCTERLEAFRVNNLIDPIQYEEKGER